MATKNHNKKRDKDDKDKVKVNWTGAEEALMVSTLLKEKDKGNQAESGWKPVVWQVLVEALATFGSVP
jgi:hypothetical protein